MSSPNLRSIYWLKYKLNPTTTFKVASEQNDEPNQSVEIELTHSSDGNSELNQTSSQFGDTVITNNSTDDPSNHVYTIKVPRLLSKYFSFMYNTGIFPDKYDDNATSRMKCILHQVLFWTFSTLSIIDAIRLIKYYSVGYVHNGDLYGYTIMSFMILKGFPRAYFMYALVCHRAKIVKVHRTIEAMTSVHKNSFSEHSRKKEMWELGCTLTLTFVGSVLATIFGSASISSGWSIEDTITLKSYQLSEVVFLWTSNSTEVHRVQDILLDEYGLVLSCTTAFLAILSAILELFGHIYDNAVDDIFLLVAITIKVLMSDFKFEAVLPTQLEIYSDRIWRHYRQLQTVCEDLDSAFGKLFKITHFSNLIRCAYYLLTLTVDSRYDVHFVLFTITIFKLGVTYLVAVKASNKNKCFRRWIQRTYIDQPYIFVENKRLKTSLVLDELTTNPIGLGSDNFHVDESFVIKFIGLVASYFMFLAESKEKSSI